MRRRSGYQLRRRGGGRHFAEAMAMAARCARRRRRGLCDKSVAGGRGWSPSQGLRRRPVNLGTPTPACECCDVRIFNSEKSRQGKIYGDWNDDERRRHWQEECQRRVGTKRWRTSTTARVKIGRANPRPCKGIDVGGGGGGGGGEGTAALGDGYIDTMGARLHTRVSAGKSVGIDDRFMASYHHRRWRVGGGSLERRRWRDRVGNTMWRWELSPGARKSPGQQAQTKMRCFPRACDSNGFEEAVPVRGEGGGGEGEEEGDAGNAVQRRGDAAAAADKDQASFNLSSSSTSSSTSSSSSSSSSSFSPSSSSSQSSDSYLCGNGEEDHEGRDCNDVKRAKAMEVVSSASSSSSVSSSSSDYDYQREQEVVEEEKRLGKHLDDGEKKRQSSAAMMGGALPPPSPLSAFADVWREQGGEGEADGGGAEEETDMEKRGGGSVNEGLLSGWDGLFPPPDLLRVGGGEGGRGGRSALKAAADAVAGQEDDQFVIPILPLGKVKFPTESIPLQLFEPRYRFMFKMINQSKSKRFGVVWADRSSATMEAVGVLCHLTLFYRVPQNGRILVNALAVCRFRVKAIIFDKPFITAEVVPTYDADDEGLAEMAETAVVERRVWQCMQDVRRLAGKLYGHLGSLAREEVFSREVLTWRPATEEDEEDDDERLGKEGEREREGGGGWRRRSKRVVDNEGRWVNERRRSEWFSFAVARSLIDIPLEQQQSLLDMTSTRDRLRACEEVLSDGCKYLAARSSLMDIFSR